ncbi:MAG: type II toxin-antitoxin system VapC family toxin [Alphaproteobacteria bacterium]
MTQYMLDTNICIYVIQKRPPALRQKFSRLVDQLCISSVTLAELHYGAEKSEQRANNLRTIENFTARLDVLPFTPKAAEHFGEIRAELERAGKPVGAYDLMIGAHARSEGLVLVTNNTREFDRMPGLRIENWVR